MASTESSSRVMWPKHGPAPKQKRPLPQSQQIAVNSANLVPVEDDDALTETESGSEQGISAITDDCQSRARKGGGLVLELLHKINLSHYAGVFAEQEVDESLLPMLTMEDLKEMGIAAVGPRRKIFHAIEQLKEC